MVEPGALSAASSVQRVQERLWHQAWTQARSSSILRVSVLGGSVACGAGAAFPSSEADLASGRQWVHGRPLEIKSQNIWRTTRSAPSPLPTLSLVARRFKICDLYLYLELLIEFLLDNLFGLI